MGEVIEVMGRGRRFRYLRWSPGGVDEVALMKRARGRGVPVVVVGPTATGKSTLVELASIQADGAPPTLIAADSKHSPGEIEEVLRTKDGLFSISGWPRADEWAATARSIERIAAVFKRSGALDRLVAIELTFHKEDLREIQAQLREWTERLGFEWLLLPEPPGPVMLEMAKLQLGWVKET